MPGIKLNLLAIGTPASMLDVIFPADSSEIIRIAAAARILARPCHLEELGAQVIELSSDYADQRANAPVFAQKKLSDFAKVPHPFSTNRVEDGIYIYPPDPVSEGAVSPRKVDPPYVLSLSDARAYPPQHIVRKNRYSDNQALEANGRVRLQRGILVARENTLIPDSFARQNGIPRGPLLDADGNWQMFCPEIEETIERDCVWLETISVHFGHAILENTNRIWAALTEEIKTLKDPLFVGFPLHNPASDPKEWPSFLKEIYDACGCPIGSVKVINKPTKFRNLYVPSATSPMSVRGSNRTYAVTMARIGRNVAKGAATQERPKRLYLSRSKLGDGKRKLINGAELVLERCFRKLGFTVLHTETMPFAEQIASVRAADHIAGCVGSQLHLLAMCDNPALKVFRIAPKYFNPNFDKHIVTGLGGKIETFVVDQPELATRGHLTSWSISNLEMARLQVAARLWAGHSQPGWLSRALQGLGAFIHSWRPGK